MALVSQEREEALSPKDTGLSGCSMYYLLLPGQCKVPGKRRSSLPSSLALLPCPSSHYSWSGSEGK